MSKPSFWWVNQGSSYELDRDGQRMWAPMKDKNGGKPNWSWQKLTEVAVGDVVFNYSKLQPGNVRQIRAVSQVIEDWTEATNLSEEPTAKWQGIGYMVKLRYWELEQPINFEEIPQEFLYTEEENTEKYRFFNKYYKINEGYLFPLSKAFTTLLIENFKERLPAFLTEKPNSKTVLNTILFGPPGTGKTYTVQRKAVEVIEPAAELSDREIAEKFRSYREDGRIEFVTFHPSFSYEEFVEGFRYDESKKVPTLHDGVFKRICKRAVNPNQRSEVRDGARIWKVALGSADEPHVFERCMENGEIAIGWLRNQNLSESVAFWEDEPKLFEDQLRLIFEENYPDEKKSPQSVLNFVSRMKVGDYVAVRSSKTNIRAIGIITGDYEFREDYDEYPHVRSVEWLDTEEHDIQNLNGGKELTQQTVYALERISIPKIVELLPSSKRREKPYVLIIDEINRGNISRIFGELITLLEPDKRRGAEHELSVTLPYSGEDFSVPGNLHVIGTMNTADRSIALLDVALRRRFEFEEMMPRVDVVEKVLEEKGAEPYFIKLVCRVFETLNARITALLDRDHQLGHSYFLSATSPENLHHALYKRIFPLLQEYFYNDMEQLGHVLGEYSEAEGEKQGFVRKSSLGKKLGAGFDTEHLRELHRYEVDEIKGVLDRTFPEG